MAEWPTPRDIIQCDSCDAVWGEQEVYQHPCSACGCWSGVTLDSLESDPPRKLRQEECDVQGST